MLINAFAFLPSTGERTDIWPYVIGISLLAVAIVLIFLKTRKHDDDDDDISGDE